MALRVLLADESSSIKRVMELALQDFAVEVKPVFLGPDVLAITKQFKPDIIFVDILLQKMSGYEVSQALKKIPELARIPIVMMWSGFMELDEEKFKSSQADSKLEKPFTSDQLRKLIRELVPKTTSQSLSEFIQLPEIIESLNQENRQGHPKDGAVNATENAAEAWNMESFAPIENFAEPTGPDNESWVQTNLNKFKVPEPKTDEEFLSEISTPPAPLKDKSDKSSKLVKRDPQVEANGVPLQQKIFAEPKITEAELEPIIRKQAKEMIDSIIWKIVPDMAERIIKEEIQRLLHEKDGQIHLD
ncbi:MAG: response regulator [Pseudomonadota bacterium]|mgnify:CR=1 FL=1|nr:response regulator [Pseudomonadota bacterium]